MATSPEDDPLAQYAAAIKGNESGGRYGVVGPTHPRYGRALGAYQVMESNLPEWSQRHLGRQVTADEFLASPEIQDKIFQGEFGSYVEKYGPQGAAAAWFSGSPNVNSGSKDVLGTTVPAYVAKFMRGLGAGPVPNMRYGAGRGISRGSTAAPTGLLAAAPSADAPAAPAADETDPTKMLSGLLALGQGTQQPAQAAQAQHRSMALRPRVAETFDPKRFFGLLASRRT